MAIPVINADTFDADLRGNLSLMLSTKCYISAGSSQRAREKATVDNLQLRGVRQIGSGQCGIVYTMMGTGLVVKIARPGKEKILFNDFQTHMRVTDAFISLGSTRPLINIPNCGEFVANEDTFWVDEEQNFPADLAKNASLISQHILPIPEPVRRAIFKQFAPKQLQRNGEQHLAEPKNKDCLVRLYLGRRQERTSSDNFKLQNFELTINEMESLHLNTEHYATVMAQTLALLHWAVGIDANDVEFVLGSAPCMNRICTADELDLMSYEEYTAAQKTLNFTKRRIGIWLLDFNQCKKIDKTSDAAIQQLVDGVYWNDPYYPRPSSGHERDEKLWVVFKTAYLETSKTVDGNRGEEFIEAWEKFASNKKPVGSLF